MQLVHIHILQLTEPTNWPRICPSVATNTFHSIKIIKRERERHRFFMGYQRLFNYIIDLFYISYEAQTTDISENSHKQDYPAFVLTKIWKFVQNRSGHSFHKSKLVVVVVIYEMILLMFQGFNCNYIMNMI